jgi:hypothetical protein
MGRRLSWRPALAHSRICYAGRWPLRNLGEIRIFPGFWLKTWVAPTLLLLLAAAPTPQPAHTEQVPPDRAVAILGATVTGPDQNDIGRIIDVLVDGTGKPRAAVIDFGGFFGVGSRKVAVSWTNLNFAPTAKTGGQISLDLTADQIKAAPEYHDTTPAAVVTARKPERPAPLTGKN